MNTRMDEKSFNEAARKIAHVLHSKLKLMEQKNTGNNCKAAKVFPEEDAAAAEDDDDNDFSFSRAFLGTDMHPADDQAYFKPVFPLFNQDLVSVHATEAMNGLKGNVRLPNRKKEFIVKMPLEDEIAGPICRRAGKREEIAAGCKKIKRIGFSKMQKFKDLIQRSKNEGRDELLLKVDLASGKGKEKVAIRIVKENELPENKVTMNGRKLKRVVKGRCSVISAHQNYICCREREEDRRRAYVARRTHMIRVFTNTAAWGTWTLSKET